MMSIRKMWSEKKSTSNNFLPVELGNLGPKPLWKHTQAAIYHPQEFFPSWLDLKVDRRLFPQITCGSGRSGTSKCDQKRFKKLLVTVKLELREFLTLFTQSVQFSFYGFVLWLYGDTCSLIQWLPRWPVHSVFRHIHFERDSAQLTLA